MALHAEFFDGSCRSLGDGLSHECPSRLDYEVIGEVESWITGEQYAYELLSSRGISKEHCQGWTVSLEDDDTEIELMGYDYVLDLIGELEVPPNAPVCKSFFLVHDGRDRSSKLRQRRQHRSTVR